MYLFGVVNCSPDSLHRPSIATSVPEAAAKIEQLHADGAEGIDVGGQASTEAASVIDAEEEWERIGAVLDLAVASADLVSVDTWRPEVMRRAMDLGVKVLNAADGMSNPASWEVAAEYRPLVVVPFLNGPNPSAVTHVVGDPLDAMGSFFDDRLRVADRYGLRDRCILDPGTGFGPDGWEWADRYAYQRHVYSHLDRLRSFGRPLYIPLPWKDTRDHAELLDIIVDQRPEYGRSHDPDRVRAVERAHTADPGSLDLGGEE